MQENEELQEEVPQEEEQAEQPAAAGEGQSDVDTEPAVTEDQELAKARAQAEEYLTLAQRVQADFDNFRRRNESVRADAYADGQRNVAGAMLTVLDNLERALESAGEDSPLKSGV